MAEAIRGQRQSKPAMHGRISVQQAAHVCA